MKYLGEVSREEWLEIAKSDSDATFFHTPYFADLLRADGKIETAYANVWEVDHGQVALPILKKKKAWGIPGLPQPSFATVESSGAGTYGGFIGTEPASGWANLYDSAFRNINEIAFSLHITENPFADQSAALSNIGETKTDFTQIIRLDSTYDEIYNNFRSGRQRNIDTAKDKGVNVRRASSKEDVEAYYDCYRDSLERWDDVTSVYGKQLFDRAWKLSQSLDDVSIWVTEVNGEIASGALICEWNGHVDYWHGAAKSEFFDYRPNDILHAKIIEDAVERGAKIYDFNPSGGHDGVVKFKKGFGPERVSFSRFKTSNQIAQLAQASAKIKNGAMSRINSVF